MSKLLTRAIVDFMESGEVSLYVAGCSAQLQPYATRAYGCRIAATDGTVTTWVSRPSAPALIEAISSNGRLALVVSHIETCKTFQLKSLNAEVALPEAGDHPRITAYHDAFIRQASSMGYPEPMLRCMMQYRIDKLAAIVFTPIAVFGQTPGPGAGAPLGTGPAE